jgi:hypothetical protein
MQQSTKQSSGLSAWLARLTIRQAQRQLKSLRPLLLDMQVILAGFIDRYALLCLTQDGLPSDFDLSPGHFIIGAGAALDNHNWQAIAAFDRNFILLIVGLGAD